MCMTGCVTGCVSVKLLLRACAPTCLCVNVGLCVHVYVHASVCVRERGGGQVVAYMCTFLFVCEC